MINQLHILLLAAVPFFEIKGAIPIGIAHNIPYIKVYILSLIGCSLPVPIIMFLAKRLFLFFEERGLFPRLTHFIFHKTVEKSKKLRYAGILGLFLFVAIPLPSTGSYSASLIASLLNMPFKEAFPAIVLGNMVAGILVLLLSHVILF